MKGLVLAIALAHIAFAYMGAFMELKSSTCWRILDSYIWLLYGGLAVLFYGYNIIMTLVWVFGEIDLRESVLFDLLSALIILPYLYFAVQCSNYHAFEASLAFMEDDNF